MIQQVGHDVERVVAVSRGFIFLCSDDLNVVLTHQTSDAPVPNLPSQRTLCVACYSFAGSGGAAHGYGPKAPYHRVVVGALDVSAKHGTHET